MYPISVCMIVKNEQENLKKSLPAIRPYVTDLHVVDTGSTDETILIAKSLGATIHSLEWKHDFSLARNFSLAQATQPTILVIDADETFDASTAKLLGTYCSSHQQRFAGQVLIQNQTAEEESSITIKLPRLFPNRPEFRYVRRIHEQLRFDQNEPMTIDTGVLFHHIGYTAAEMKGKDKINRNLQLLLAEQQQTPHDPYLLYQIAKTYYVDKQYAVAATYFQQAIDQLSLMKGISPAFLPSLLIQYAYSLLHLNEYSAVFQVLETGVELYPDYTHFYFLYGQALIQLGDPTRFQEIRQTFEYCLQLGEKSQYEMIHGVGSFMALYNLGVYYEVSGDQTAAKRYYEQSAKSGYQPAIDRLQTLFDA